MLLDIVSKFNLDDHLVPENLVTHYLNKLFVDILIFMALMPRIFKWDPHDAMQTDDMSPVTSHSAGFLWPFQEPYGTCFGCKHNPSTCKYECNLDGELYACHSNGVVFNEVDIQCPRKGR